MASDVVLYSVYSVFFGVIHSFVGFFWDIYAVGAQCLASLWSGNNLRTYFEFCEIIFNDYPQSVLLLAFLSPVGMQPAHTNMVANPTACNFACESVFYRAVIRDWQKQTVGHFADNLVKFKTVSKTTFNRCIFISSFLSSQYTRSNFQSFCLF